MAPISSQHDDASGAGGAAAPSANEAAPPPGSVSPRLPWRIGRAKAGQGIGAGQGTEAAKASEASAATGASKKARDRVVFRRGGPLVVWWLWVAFAVFNFFDVAVEGHNYFSFELTAGLLAVTAVVYACALRPRVVADEDGVRVYNPYRDHLVPWGAVNGVLLGDSLELTCARPNSKTDKVIYCWALYAGRRSQRRSQLRSDRHEARVTGRTAAEIRALRQPDAVKVIAAELGRRSDAAKQRGIAAATLESRWALLPIALVLVPAAALLGLALAH